jgi:hypothetical protein
MTETTKQAISYDEAWRLASAATWTFSTYYKYRFTFEGKAEGKTLRIVAGGDRDGIYRYLVTTDPPMSLDKILEGGECYLQVLDGAGAVLWEGWPL